MSLAGCYCVKSALKSVTSLYGLLHVTLHEKTMHIALTTDFELRPPLPTTTFKLLILQKFEVSSPRRFRDMSQNVPGSPVLQFSSRRNETLLHMLHAEVRIVTVYARYVAPPTKSMSEMAVKMLE